MRIVEHRHGRCSPSEVLAGVVRLEEDALARRVHRVGQGRIVRVQHDRVGRSPGAAGGR